MSILQQTFFGVVIALYALIACMCGAFCFFEHHFTVDLTILERFELTKPTLLLDDEGNEWARFYGDRRRPIAYAHVPQHVIDAFIATEDRDFFEHHGLSVKGIIRSFFINLYHMKYKQGASTITQQLVRLTMLDCKKTVTRKIVEQWYALIIERQLSKEHILEAYLNHVYLGAGIYGVQAASMRFWNKDIAQVTPAQAATIAAIVRSPARYCPLMCYEACKKRRDLVLRLMFEQEFLSEAQYQEALAEPCTLINQDAQCCAPHMRETLRRFLEDHFGKERVYGGGLVVHTTLNRYAQECAQVALREQCAALAQSTGMPLDGALVSIESSSGHIKALVGGIDFSCSPFNRVHARRQMGSVFKPLVYAAAVERGASFADVEVDEPLEIAQLHGVWRPNNVNKKFVGPVTLAYAMSHSNNIVAIKTMLKTGAQAVVDLAKRCHISGPFHTYPSLALGCIDASVMEVAGMFNVFAHQGVYVEPFMIRSVKDAWGKTLYKAKPLRDRVLATHHASMVTHALTLGMERVHRALFPRDWITCQAIGKTGTTNDARTCWFAGATPEYTTALYVGCDDNRSLGNSLVSVRAAFPVWLRMQQKIAVKKREFLFDASLTRVCINQFTGETVQNSRDPHAVTILV